MTGTTAAFPLPLGQPDRDRVRGLPAWRRGWARLQGGRSIAGRGVTRTAAPVGVVRDDSGWTAEEQHFLRALREAGL